jgi:peptide-methionine (S)-S-oxide reductase
MRRRLLALLLVPLLALVAPVAAQAPAKPAPKRETAIFAGGCFWCMESDMGAIPGVISVMSGYTGGQVPDPTYDIVTSERSGHYESVRVTFDPTKISYALLMDRYWRLVDPTDAGGQFCDRGPSYKTAVFVTPAQRPIAEASRAKAAAKLKTGKMTTEILPVARFYEAEQEHRNYAKNQAAYYKIYRTGCGRDAKLARVWGRPGEG